MSIVNLKFFNPPITWGCSYARLLQGVNEDGSIPTVSTPSNFLGTDTLTATVSLGQNLPSIISPSVSWINATICQVSFSITPAQSALLSPDVTYLVVVTGSRSGTSYPIVQGYLQVLPNAGSQASATPPDLATVPYVGSLLGQLSLNESQLDIIPSLITAVSNAIRRYVSREITQAVYVETVEVSLYGEIRLSQYPVQRLQLVQSWPQECMTVANNSGSVQQAWIYCEATGSSLYGFTLTSMVLNWNSYGTFSTQSIPITSGQTVIQLATAINAVGSGWTATASNDGLGQYPALQIMDGRNSKGATQNDLPGGGATFHVYSNILTDVRPNPDGGFDTGMFIVGRINSDYGGWGRWGPGPGGDYDGGGNQGQNASVCVTYLGGFSPIPADLQRAVAELVKLEIERLETPMLLKSEGADKYRYELNDKAMDAFPPWVENVIKSYQTSNA